ncbi:DUF4386 domain-containing protein [Streptomyces sp. NPDC086023]|uniref:DUF4386 domain-containing protein n=1 Tax=Streptomyces sp. NPDC086023 TaxID=3365746 RepID=UPI0037D6B6B6
MQRRTTARAVGALFVIATAAGAAGMALLGEPGTDPDREQVVGGACATTAGALLVLVMAGAIAMIPPLLFPVLKEDGGEAMAVGYVVARTVEVVLVLPGAVGPLALVAAGRAAAEAAETAGTAETATARGADAGLRAVAAWTDTYGAWGYPAASLFFCLSAVLLNRALLRSSLVPRALPVWGLVAVVPYLADAVLVLFGVLGLTSPLHALLVVPLAVNEMALALWLLVRGLSPRRDRGSGRPSPGSPRPALPAEGP